MVAIYADCLTEIIQSLRRGMHGLKTSPAFNIFTINMVVVLSTRVVLQWDSTIKLLQTATLSLMCAYSYLHSHMQAEAKSVR